MVLLIFRLEVMPSSWNMFRNFITGCTSQTLSGQPIMSWKSHMLLTLVSPFGGEILWILAPSSKASLGLLLWYFCALLEEPMAKRHALYVPPNGLHFCFLRGYLCQGFLGDYGCWGDISLTIFDTYMPMRRFMTFNPWWPTLFLWKPCMIYGTMFGAQESLCRHYYAFYFKVV